MKRNSKKKNSQERKEIQKKIKKTKKKEKNIKTMCQSLKKKTVFLPRKNYIFANLTKLSSKRMKRKKKRPQNDTYNREKLKATTVCRTVPRKGVEK